MFALVGMARELGMTPSEFFRRATCMDVGLLLAYQRTHSHLVREAEERAALAAGAESNMRKARDL